MAALERFKLEFHGWVQALNKVKGYEASPEAILDHLESRLPQEVLRQIGAAFVNGWLENEPEADRKYFVRESDRRGRRGGQCVLGHVGEGKIEPNWEPHIQLADYSRIRTVAERHGLTARLEDKLMDIAVYADSKLVLYIENKTKKEDAVRLLNRMRDYGKTGFTLDDYDKSNDPLRKCKYLVRNDMYPQYFALSAIGYERVFLVEYLGSDNRFALHETQLSLTGPLVEAVNGGGMSPLPSVFDPLALEIERLAGDQVWISPGSGMTAYNFYSPSFLGDALFLGVYEDGRIWSDNKTLGDETAERLAGNLESIGIFLDPSKDWCFWKRNNRVLSLADENPVEIAEQVVAAIIPDNQGISLKINIGEHR